MQNNIFFQVQTLFFIHKKFIQRQKRLHSIKQKIFKKGHTNDSDDKK